MLPKLVPLDQPDLTEWEDVEVANRTATWHVWPMCRSGTHLVPGYWLLRGMRDMEDERDHDFALTLTVDIVGGYLACSAAALTWWGTPKRVGTAEWRGLPLGQLVEASINASVSERAYSGRESVTESPDDQVRRVSEVEAEHRRRPGPKPQMTDRLLREVVAPAYIGGGRHRTAAVRAGLAAAGYSNGTVTTYQASKAIVQARRAGHLPPAIGKGKP